VLGPYVHGDQFAVHFAVELEGPEGRGTMREIALYTVRDGRIVEERFFAAPDR
jgi:ketosteroid isomerase-like protein